MNGWPGKAALFKSFVNHDEAGAVPNQDLDPVSPLRPKHHDDARMWIEPQLVLHDGNQAIVTFAEIDRLGGNDDADVLTWDDHRDARRAAAIDAIRSAALSTGRRTVTSPTLSSIDPS